MKRKLLITLTLLLVILTASCRTTYAPDLFSDVVAPPSRPELRLILGDDITVQFRIVSENLIKTITTIERWEAYQQEQDYYYM